jgi:secreted Zn-dependent insulinase-like peptidase
MPAPSLPATEHLTLANGLRVVVCHVPRLKRAAASLRVAAGSHDVPLAWPGLAHFLEHLFFLGTERFANEHKLMTFVQRHGGQLNASTRERTTDFFFELPVPVFAQGLERLCEMLAHPRMNLADQLREREVLHAEFIAWSRDAATRQQLRLLDALSPRHPLRAFHAGNRYSLPVPRQAFQQALHDFYQRFYQAGQITLCLTGPQSLDELKALATAHGTAFAKGGNIPQALPPALLDHPTAPIIDIAAGRVNLLLAFEDLPDAADEATAFLCHYLNANQGGSLIAVLRESRLVESFKAQAIYQFAGQALIHIEAVTASPDAVSPLLFSWLSFFSHHWPALRDDYNRLQQRRLDVSGALDLAHHHSRALPPGLSDQGATALVALLGQLKTRGDQPDEEIHWQLPKANPFLGQPSTTQGEGAVYLRWRLPSAQPRLWQMLDQRLQSLVEDAQQAGVNLAFTAYGNYWQFRLSGIDTPMPGIVEQALGLFDATHFAPHETLRAEPALIPIRQLLKALPDHYLISPEGSVIEDPQCLWPLTRRTTFITGVSPAICRALDSILSQAPGAEDHLPLHAPALKPGKHWRPVVSDSSEHAILLFCPTPSASIADEAAWRQLAHLAQGPFYQRLRVELQLGYGVFSGLRQIAGQCGLLFGVQSPGTSVEQLVQHVSDFIQQLPQLIEAADLPGQAQALTAQLDLASLESPQVAELLWQAHLAGHGVDYLSQLHSALTQLEKTTLLSAARQLRIATGGWLCLTNSLHSPFDGTP